MARRAERRGGDGGAAKRQLPTSVVVAVDLLAGVALGLLVWGLTGLPSAGVVIGLVVALGLGVLAVAGSGMNRRYRVTQEQAAEAARRRRQVLDAFEETRRNRPGEDDPPRYPAGP
jgi:hypothetical protein